MNWNNVFFLAGFHVLAIAPKTDQYLQGESSRSNEGQQEYLEELYDENFVFLLNSLSTLDETNVVFDRQDFELLSTDCYINDDCLKYKQASLKKYHQKMQAIQCVNGLFVLNVLDELGAIMCDKKSSNDIGQLTVSLRPVISKYKFYLSRMLSMLHIANWEAYAWQLELFTFVVELAASDTNYGKYKDHFVDYHLNMRTEVLAFVGQCVRFKYLKCPEGTTISSLAENVYAAANSLYKNIRLTYAYRMADRYTVPNLMLAELHADDEFIYDWSMIGIDLRTAKVQRRLAEYLRLFNPQQLCHHWELDPIHGNKYNALVADCIRLRCVFHVWFHLYTYQHTLRQGKPLAPRLQKLWHALVLPVQSALRLFWFKENVYWSAMRLMLTDLGAIGVDEMAARENYTRNYFCQAVESLGLANASDVNRQMTKFQVSQDHQVTCNRITDNADMLHGYTVKILRALNTDDGAFVQMIVSAKVNETFVVR